MIVEFDGKKPQIGANTFIAPNATLIGDVVIEDDVSVWYGAVLRGDFGKIVIKRGTSIQDNAIVHAIPDYITTVGENVTIAHGAIIHGCYIEKDVIVGMGAIVQDSCFIGESSIIAAGSVIPANMKVPPKHLVAGVPASIKKELTVSLLKQGEQYVQMYRELADKYNK